MPKTGSNTEEPRCVKNWNIYHNSLYWCLWVEMKRHLFTSPPSLIFLKNWEQSQFLKLSEFRCHLSLSLSLPPAPPSPLLLHTYIILRADWTSATSVSTFTFTFILCSDWQSGSRLGHTLFTCHIIPLYQIYCKSNLWTNFVILYSQDILHPSVLVVASFSAALSRVPSMFLLYFLLQ